MYWSLSIARAVSLPNPLDQWDLLARWDRWVPLGRSDPWGPSGLQQMSPRQSDRWDQWDLLAQLVQLVLSALLHLYCLSFRLGRLDPSVLSDRSGQWVPLHRLIPLCPWDPWDQWDLLAQSDLLGHRFRSGHYLLDLLDRLDLSGRLGPLHLAGLIHLDRLLVPSVPSGHSFPLHQWVPLHHQHLSCRSGP